MATRQARRQLQFSGFEMSLLAVGYLLSVTVVFSLGLFVGKKNASHHAPAEDRVARVPVDDFTKYKRPEPIARIPKEPKASPADAASVTVAAVDKGAAGEKGTSAPLPGATAASASPAGKADTVAAPAIAVTEVAIKEASLSAKEASGKDAAAKEAAAKAAAAKEKEDAEAETGRGYTVQILATRKQADADALVRKLKSRGYAAYIKKVSDGAGAWYRVRVGSYGAFSQARAMADKCRQDLGLGQAFVSTE